MANNICTENVDIIDSINLQKNCLSVLERYYTPMYCLTINDTTPIEDHCLLFHSNRICLITIGKHHPVLLHKKEIKSINCEFDGKDRSQNKVTGKGKRGGQKLKPETLLCRIECSDGSTHDIYSCIKGKLITINKQLLKNPGLLLEKPNTEGHIAIILSDLYKIEDHKKHMLMKDEYLKRYSELNE